MFRLVLVIGAAVALAGSAAAQPLGTFRWKTEPYCNVITLTVTQHGPTYALDGFDDQCAAAVKAPVTGLAVPNADGTIQFGLTIVTASGVPDHLAVPLSVATLGGPWKDGAGNTGTFVFNPSRGSGSPRPRSAPPVPSAISLSPDGALVAGGQSGVGTVPASGRGVRMMWYPGKAAFRVGEDRIGMWDDSAIGYGSVAMGNNPLAAGNFSVAIGRDAAATAVDAVALGFNTQASGDKSVAIGNLSIAAGFGSVALGTNARTSTNGFGSFVFGDASGLPPVVATTPNEFRVRAAGGTMIFSNGPMSTGVRLAPGSSAWSTLSDVNSKDHFTDLDAADVLAKIARMPIREWSYKAQDAAIRHVGPTAQDFSAAFGLGEDPLRISTIDADGIALRAIQALEARTRVENEALRLENGELRSELDALRARLDVLEGAKK
ncbi:MAG: tail fiber domain-containing protein [Vicinamibacterales bacterium]